MVNTVADRVSALMSAGGQHGCWSVAALPLPSGTCETRGTRGTFSNFELAGVRRIVLLCLWIGCTVAGDWLFACCRIRFLQQG